MGLTVQSTGTKAIKKRGTKDKGKVIALAGNPNVGKSTVFNSLTGLKQHTGNWPGKTITNARGRYRHKGEDFTLVDLPGTYSLMASSVEEEVARDFICFAEVDAVVIVADATCLERNLNLVLQTLEITGRAVVCVNLIDEAKRKNISVDIKKLSKLLGVPVIAAAARSGRGMTALMDAVYDVAHGDVKKPLEIKYSDPVERAIEAVQPFVGALAGGRLNSRWAALKLLEGDETLIASIEKHIGIDMRADENIWRGLEEARNILRKAGIAVGALRDETATSVVKAAEAIFRETVHLGKEQYDRTDRRIDRVLTSKVFGIPIMLALLGLVFWLTIIGANVPSRLLSDGLFWLGEQLGALLSSIGTPQWLYGLLVEGVYRTLAWVVSVMLPPMAIFFPLFTLLEDLGYLPRVAFNLDRFFKKACACGKQALAMCMGFGCNAAGVTGCRIIDSPRERLIATVTNSFVPCNGRFPTLIAIITMFFAAAAAEPFASAISALMLVAVVLFGIVMTLAVSKLLSKTILKGLPSSFTLELPPYRMPQIGKVLVRSVLDRTLFVLGRAAAVAAPAGLVIWAMANIEAGGISLLAHCASFLDPFARLIGLDGFILMAFILGFPANEIVVPIIIMSYMASGSLTELSSLTELRELLAANGWTWLTAVCTMLFSLMHWPCGTTCWTIRKETQSWKWTAVSVLLPTVSGMAVCFIVASAARLLGLV